LLGGNGLPTLLGLGLPLGLVQAQLAFAQRGQRIPAAGAGIVKTGGDQKLLGTGPLLFRKGRAQAISLSAQLGAFWLRGQSEVA
jgi:hypothetical protein